MSVRKYGIIVSIPIDKIDDSPFQVRMEYGEITKLAANIKKLGLLAPILVRPIDKRYEVVHGHRRLKAYKHLTRKYIPGIIKEFTDKQALIIHGSENIQREEFSPIETARYYKQCRTYFSVKEIAKRMEKSESHVKEHLYLVNLPEDIQADIHSKKLSVRKARELARLAISTDVTAVTSDKGLKMGSTPATPTTKYFDQIRVLSKESSKAEGLKDAKAVSIAANLVKKGIKVEKAVEVAKKDYATRKSKERVNSKAPSATEVTKTLIGKLKGENELNKEILAQYPKLVQKMVAEGKLGCPHCGDGTLVWECCGSKIDE